MFCMLYILAMFHYKMIQINQCVSLNSQLHIILQTLLFHRQREKWE